MDVNIILKCENKDFRNIIMPSENTKTLEFNQYLNFDKTPPAWMFNRKDWWM